MADEEAHSYAATEPAIEVAGLEMTFRAPVRESGWQASVRSVFRRRYVEVPAVHDVSFVLQRGEVVGFIGPNGAGKTTTMKMLAGLLHPTAGEVRVLGRVPWRRAPSWLRRIALIRGSQPVGGSAELTVSDALEYQRLLYDVSTTDYRRNLGELTELLGLQELRQRQLRALSLGERMRAGLALALIYRPEVMFLDEPTIGLDTAGAITMRRFIADYAGQTGATVLLTSHSMADVEALCPRLIMIDRGRVRYDGSLRLLAGRLSPDKLIRLTAPATDEAQLRSFADVIEAAEGSWVLRVPRDEVARITARLLTELEVADLAVEEAPLEVIIDRAYREGVG